MSFLKSIWSIQTRSFSQTPSVSHKTSKSFHRLSKYVRKVNDTQHHAGEEIKGIGKIPSQQAELPVYQYEARFFKRQNRGLYGGLQRRSGHTCSEAENKNKRTYLPNIVNKRLWSEALNTAIKLRVSTKVLKTITKDGGLDEYLTKDTSTRIKTLGLKGWELKYKVLKAREFAQLPNYNGLKVYYIHPDGKEFIVEKEELVEALYPFVHRDSFEGVNKDKFVKESSVLTFEELVNQLEAYNFDFTNVTVQEHQRVASEREEVA
ncbi:54S ribosomal protein L24, mitochondrial [[Candida] railenensis]|uniref:Large ribosomal subunit protein bL28m n=1 Tax=[Candida] railenensis TaxID=45579 RepID=A0A9P0VX49_9ASCO|nr:54S ribosomal protein L24, mitochondrial [[Candida] railenensis]